MMTNSKLSINLLSFFLICIAPTFVSALTLHEGNWFCLDMGNYTANSTYQNNLKPLLVYLTEQASHAAFGNYSVGEGIDRANMLYNCRGDLSQDECHFCVQSAVHRIIAECPVQKTAMFWFQECMIRYSNETIFSIESEDLFIYDCGYANVSDPVPYDKAVAETVDGLIMEAAYNGSKVGYATGEGNVSGLVKGDKLYCYVQCTPDILGNRCERCLRAAFRAIAGVCGTTSESVMFYYPSCQIHYSPVAFIGAGAPSPASLPSLPTLPPNSTSQSPPKTGGSTARMIKADGDILIFGLIVAVTMLFLVPTN